MASEPKQGSGGAPVGGQGALPPKAESVLYIFIQKVAKS